MRWDDNIQWEALCVMPQKALTNDSHNLAVYTGWVSGHTYHLMRSLNDTSFLIWSFYYITDSSPEPPPISLLEIGCKVKTSKAGTGLSILQVTPKSLLESLNVKGKKLRKEKRSEASSWGQLQVWRGGRRPWPGESRWGGWWAGCWWGRGLRWCWWWRCCD